MRPEPANTRMLKGLLLLALLANFSWRPALRSLNLSSETVSPAAAPPAPATPAQPIATVTTPQANAPRVELPKVCGLRLYVTYTYSEKTMVDNSTQAFTTAKIELHTGEINNFKPISIQFLGGFDQNLDKSDVKKDNDNTIATAVKRHVSNCPDDSAPPVQSNSNRNAPDKETAKKDKEDIKTGMAACRLNSRGNPLSEVEQTRCQLQSLTDMDTGVDDYAGRTKVMNKIDQLVQGNLRKSIKNRLMSKDDSKVDEGEELLQETVDAINDLTGSMSLDSSRMSRIVMSLQSLRSGGETYRRSVALEDQVKESRNTLHDQLLEAATDVQANPGNYAMQARLLQVRAQVTQQEQQFMLQAQTQISQPYSSMVVANRLGYLPATDFGQFAQPYQQLQTDITSMLNTNQLLYGNSFPMLGSIGALGSLGVGLGVGLGNIGSLAPQVPANYLQVRTGLANNLPVTYNMTNPSLSSGLTPLYTPGTAITTLTTGQVGQVAPIGLGINSTYVPSPLPTLPSGLQLGTTPF